jgi:hypothetical protein
MGERQGDFTREKLVVGILTVSPDRQDELVRLLEDRFGPVDRIAGPFPFTFTDYYDQEMGPGIERWFLSFEKLVDPGRLPEIKIFTNEVEQLFSQQGQRRVNLDPGLLSTNRFVLATTKERGHRIPLQSGIYAEVTLLYMNKGFQTLGWTYADFATDEYRTLLKEIRSTYLKQLR